MSNLSFLSKVIERAVAHQLGQYLDANALHHPYQSAYRSGHSVETALTRVHSDIMQALDQKQGIILVLLDLSAAFDTVDHTVLLSRLETRFGVGGSVLSWLRSYLSDRQQQVTVAEKRSAPRALEHGVPQGSVLGPVLFSCYIAPLYDITRKQLISTHQYADDDELYVAFRMDKTSACKSMRRMEDCVSDIKDWMCHNKLKLNDDKTDMLVITSPRLQSRVPISSMTIGEIEVPASPIARNLGTTFDCVMNMEKHINNICSSCYYHLRNLSAIRGSLTQEATERLVHAFITSRLDNGNALFYALPSKLTAKLQRVQNTAARIVTKTSRSHSISAVLKQLHWLPVKQRIQYKILTLTWKSLHGQAPGYIDELLTPYVPSRTLRSASSHKLVTPKCESNYGKRAFASAAPELWNALPMPLKETDAYTTFKAKLKTYMCNIAYAIS